MYVFCNRISTLWWSWYQRCPVWDPESWRHFLETGPDPIAMVIRVELFTLKPSETIQICTAWLLMHDYVTGGFCLQGLWMDSSNLITLLKSDVTRRDHVVRCHGSHECWFTHRQFHSQFHLRRHSLRITLKYTTLVHMRSSYAWTMKSWQRSEWRLGFNSVLPWQLGLGRFRDSASCALVPEYLVRGGL